MQEHREHHRALDRMTKFQTKLGLVLVASILFFTGAVCSSGYLTPAGLTATAAATMTQTVLPTAHFIRPTDTLTPPPTETPTPDPRLATATPIFSTPTPSATPLPTPTLVSADNPPAIYYAQSGDTLQGLATRFSVHPFEIVSPESIAETGLINPGQMLMIPQRLVLTTSNVHLLPDSEIVYSPAALDFDTETFVDTLGGYLSTYTEYLNLNGTSTGGEIVEIAALSHSINPRLLLSLIEFNSHWVLGEPSSFSEELYPMGYISVDDEGLQIQLSWAAKQISVGYYSWRAGTLTELEFRDGSRLRLAPDLNAGTVGLMYYFSLIYSKEQWTAAVDPDTGFVGLHRTMFGDPWARADMIGPILPNGIQQPDLILPFVVGDIWAFTGGPHGAWTIEGAQAALDFAPGSTAHGCAASDVWATAAATGMIVRMENGVMILDLDGDGKEQTGWVLFYLHLIPHPSLKVGDWVDQGDIIGHPSCEGGRATGTHIHIARKYNGEWILADGPIPFILSGWQAHNGTEPYEGTLTNGDQTITASPSGSYATRIYREDDGT